MGAYALSLPGLVPSAPPMTLIAFSLMEAVNLRTRREVYE